MKPEKRFRRVCYQRNLQSTLPAWINPASTSPPVEPGIRDNCISPVIRVTAVAGVTGKMGERFPVTSVTAVTEALVQPCEAVCAALGGWTGETHPHLEKSATLGACGPIRRGAPGVDKTHRAAGTGKRPPMVGQASRPAIRRAALAGAKPRHPLPLKGRKERNAEKENGDHHSQDDAG